MITKYLYIYIALEKQILSIGLSSAAETLQ